MYCVHVDRERTIGWGTGKVEPTPIDTIIVSLFGPQEISITSFRYTCAYRIGMETCSMLIPGLGTPQRISLLQNVIITLKYIYIYTSTMFYHHGGYSCSGNHCICLQESFPKLPWKPVAVCPLHVFGNKPPKMAHIQWGGFVHIFYSCSNVQLGNGDDSFWFVHTFQLGEQQTCRGDRHKHFKRNSFGEM